MLCSHSEVGAKLDKLCQILYFTENIKKLASDRQFQNLFDLWFNSYVTSFSKLHLDAGVVARAVITSYYFNVLIIKTLRHHGHYHNSAHTTPSSDTPLGLMVSHHIHRLKSSYKWKVLLRFSGQQFHNESRQTTGSRFSECLEMWS